MTEIEYEYYCLTIIVNIWLGIDIILCFVVGFVQIGELFLDFNIGYDNKIRWIIRRRASQPKMMKLRYKIVSCSSHDPQFPGSNLVLQNEHWESSRFCEYPQHITIMFYEPVKINSITIISHPSKISSRINILYQLPNHSIQDFTKLGYITFSNNEHTSYQLKQAKKINQLDIQTLYVRLILYKNHQNVHNFFNQVGLQCLTFQGTGYQYILPIMSKSQVTSNYRSEFIETKLSLLSQFKQQFIIHQQFNEANQIKSIISLVKNIANNLRKVDESKMQAIKEEDYDKAIELKKQTDQLKQDVNHIINNFYDPINKTINPIHEKFKKVLGDGNYLHNSLVQPPNHVQQDQQDQQDQQEVGMESRVSYEDRILPAILNKKKFNLHQQQTHDNEFLEPQEKTISLQPQQLSPINEANASLLFEFYDHQFVRKLHSKHWQLKQQAFTQVTQQLEKIKGPTSKNKLKCLIFIYNKAIKESSLALCSLAFEIMLKTLNLTPPNEFKSQAHHQLEHAVQQTILKISDNNQKISKQALNIFHHMPNSQLFGIQLCFNAIAKPSFDKPTIKQKKSKIQCLKYLVETYGVGSGLVPIQSVDFTIKMAQDPNNEVRNNAKQLLKIIKEKGGKSRVTVMAQSANLKNSIQKQLISDG